MHLFEQIKSLNSWQQMAYGAALVARMSANYRLFSQLSGVGDGQVFSNILQLVWQCAAGQNDNIDFMRQQDKLTAITPDPAGFDGYGVWPALDACAALCALLSVCHSLKGGKDKLSAFDELVSIVTLSRSTIEQLLQATDDVDDIEQHPLIIADNAFNQWAVLQLLNEPRRKESVTQLRIALQEDTTSNIGIGDQQ